MKAFRVVLFEREECVGEKEDFAVDKLGKVISLIRNELLRLESSRFLGFLSRFCLGPCILLMI